MSKKESAKWTQLATICQTLVKQITGDERRDHRKLGLPPVLVNELMELCDELKIPANEQPLRIENASSTQVREIVARMIAEGKPEDGISLDGKCWSASPYGEAATTIVAILWTWVSESDDASVLLYEEKPESLWDAFAIEAKRNLNEWHMEANERAKANETATKPKKSTANGDAKAKLQSAFVEHHKYENGSIGNLEPIGNNALARKAGVAESTAKAFFDKWYKRGGLKEYQRDANGARTKLLITLKQFSDEAIVGMMNYGTDPGEIEAAQVQKEIGRKKTTVR